MWRGDMVLVAVTTAVNFHRLVIDGTLFEHRPWHKLSWDYRLGTCDQIGHIAISSRFRMVGYLRARCGSRPATGKLSCCINNKTENANKHWATTYLLLFSADEAVKLQDHPDSWNGKAMNVSSRELCWWLRRVQRSLAKGFLPLHWQAKYKLSQITTILPIYTASWKSFQMVVSLSIVMGGC